MHFDLTDLRLFAAVVEEGSISAGDRRASDARLDDERHSDLFFILEHHITLTHTQLASRLVEVRSQTLKLV